MDSSRFDALTKRLTTRLTRRSALTGGAGLAAAGLSLPSRQAAAQEATPVTPGAQLKFLFVQNATSGTYEPDSSASDTAVLTLQGALGQTLYFAERPSRLAGSMPTPNFLALLDFSTSNPPNAALIIEAEEEDTVLILELTDPQYEEAAGTLTYRTRTIADYRREPLKYFAWQETGAQPAESFGPASLFIDADQSCGQCGSPCEAAAPDCCPGFNCVGPEGFWQCYADCCEDGCDCAC